MMDFLDPKKKRAYNIRLGIGLILTAIVLILGTVILALITAGYDINRQTGQVIQNGLVFVNTHPVSANIYVNGKSKGTTSARLELPSGTYNFRLYEPGYTTWNLSVNLQGGTVDQLVYPFLFPLKPVTSVVSTIASQPDVSTESPNQHWLVTSTPSQFGTFQQVDVTNIKAPVTSFSIPTSILTSSPTNSWQLIGWANDNDHILLKHIFSTGYEYIVVDRTNPTLSFNLNKAFPNTVFTAANFDSQNYTKYYLYNSASNSLSMGDEAAQTVVPVLNNLLDYWPYSTNEILYATPDPNSTSDVLIKLLYNNKVYNIRKMPTASQYLLNIASYGSNSYVVVGDSSDTEAYIYQNPISEIQSAPHPSEATPVPYTLLVVGSDPDSLSFSTSARFVALQAGSQFDVYDFQTQTHYSYDTGLSLAQDEVATWMDGDRLTLTSNNKLSIFDFDGTNQVSFSDNTNSFLPAFNSVDDAIYSTVPSTTPAGSAVGQWEILRTSLIAPVAKSSSKS
jgi:hypothetical protein